MASDKVDGSEFAVEDLIMCSDCQGLGTRREQYNHMLIDRTCTKCDGDGIVPRRGAEPVRRDTGDGTMTTSSVSGDGAAAAALAEGAPASEALEGAGAAPLRTA